MSEWHPGQGRREQPFSILPTSEPATPPPREPQPEPRRQGNRLLRGCGITSIGCLAIIGGAVVLAVILIAVAVGSSGGDDAEVVTEDEAEDGGEPSGEVLNLELGQTARIGDLEVTALGCRMGTSEFLEPDPGFRWVVVDVQGVNTGDDVYELSSLLQTSIRDSQGVTHDFAIGPDTTGSFDGSVQPGETIRGEIAYSVPVDVTTGLQWRFEQFRLGSSEEARWNLVGC